MLKNLLKSNFVKILSLNSISIFVKLIAGFLSMKVVATLLSPNGMALLGNFRSFTAIIKSISTLGFETGIVKYTASHKSKPKQLNRLLSTSYISTLSISLLLIVILFIFSNEISLYLFKSTDYVFAIRIFSLLFPLYGVHIILISFLNGLQKFKAYILISIFATIISTAITVALTWYYNLKGALVALAIVESIIVIISFIYVYKKQDIKLSLNLNNFSRDYLKRLLSFSIMTLVTTVLSQFSILYIRQELIDIHGGDEAGYWEMISRISNNYIIFICSGISLYYLPKLAEATSKNALKTEVSNYFKTLVPLTVFLFLGIYTFREQIIYIILSNDYLPVKELFSLQLIGDFIKICAFAFSYQFLAKKMVKEYIITEILFYIIYLGTSLLLIKTSGPKGVLTAYVISYICYLIMMLYIFRDHFLQKKIRTKP